jgi:RNA 2',3'-cyclic 3'-phosphodiesterase
VRAARLFVAVVPPAAVLDRVASLPRPEVEGLRWTSRDQWHVTLRFLGRVTDVDAVTAALQPVSLVRCEARLGPEVGRFGRRVLHVPVAGLDDLAAAVVATTSALGEPPEDRPFAAHITLARARARRGIDLRALTGEPVAGEWPVDDVCLIESRLHPHGARYETLLRVRTMEP